MKNWKNAPAIVYSELAAEYLGFKRHDIPILINSKLLDPCGRPAKNGPKRFSKFDLEAKAKDPDWLNKAAAAIHKHWRQKNSNKRNR